MLSALHNYTVPSFGYCLPTLLRCNFRLFSFLKDVQDMEERLPKELEKHLKRKAFSILSYIQPESGALFNSDSQDIL